MPNLGLLAEQAGLKHVVISFVLAKNNACDPAWYGTEPLDSLKADIELFRRAGGSITVATGGARAPTSRTPAPPPPIWRAPT